MLSTEERENRRNWINATRRSSAIEGICPDQATIDIEEAYVRGELTGEQFADALADKCGVPRYDHKAISALCGSLECGDIDIEEFLLRYDALTGGDRARCPAS